MMRISKQGLEFLKKHEGCVLYAYQNWLAKSKKWDVPTIGYGYTVGVKMGTWHLNSKGNRRCSDTVKITQAQAEGTLLDKVTNYENIVRKAFQGVELSQGMYDALCSIAWNCGSFNKSLITAIKQNPYSKTTENEMKNHRIGAASVLAKRRVAEWGLFTSGGDKEVITGTASGRPPIKDANYASVPADFGSDSGGASSTTSAASNVPLPAPTPAPPVETVTMDLDEYFDKLYPQEEEPAAEETGKSTSSTEGETAAEGEAAAEGESEEENNTDKSLRELLEAQCGGLEIPGLSVDEVLEKMAEKCPSLQMVLGGIKKAKDKIEDKYKELDDKYDDSDEEDIDKKAKLKKMLDEEKKALTEQEKQALENFYKENKDKVTQKINTIKISFKALSDSLTELGATVTSAMVSIALPSFIGTGSPNPAKAVNEFITLKHQLKSAITPCLTNATNLLTASQDICFVVPPPVTTVIDSIGKISKAIDGIPG